MTRTSPVSYTHLDVYKRQLPGSLGLSGQRVGNKVTFTAQPGTDITFLPDGNYNGRVLHLFIREPLTDIPDIQSSSVIHYSPGYYDLSGQPPLMLTSGQRCV